MPANVLIVLIAIRGGNEAAVGSTVKAAHRTCRELVCSWSG